MVMVGCIYICMYCIVRRTCTAYGHHVRGPSGNTCACFYSRCFAACMFSASSMQRALKPSQPRQGKQLGHNAPHLLVVNDVIINH